MFDTTSARAFNNLGSVLAEKGMLREAGVLFARAVAIDSTYADAFYNLGNVTIDQGDRKKGLEYLRRSALLGNERAKQQLAGVASR